MPLKLKIKSLKKFSILAIGKMKQSDIEKYCYENAKLFKRVLMLTQKQVDYLATKKPSAQAYISELIERDMNAPVVDYNKEDREISDYFTSSDDDCPLKSEY